MNLLREKERGNNKKTQVTISLTVKVPFDDKA